MKKINITNKNYKKVTKSGVNKIYNLMKDGKIKEFVYVGINVRIDGSNYIIDSKKYLHKELEYKFVINHYNKEQKEKAYNESISFEGYNKNGLCYHVGHVVGTHRTVYTEKYMIKNNVLYVIELKKDAL